MSGLRVLRLCDINGTMENSRQLAVHLLLYNNTCNTLSSKLNKATKAKTTTTTLSHECALGTACSLLNYCRYYKRMYLKAHLSDVLARVCTLS